MQALLFSGSDAKVDLGDLDIEDAFSIECWIRPENIEDKSYILQKLGPGEDDNYALYVEGGSLFFSCNSLEYNNTEEWEPVRYTMSWPIPSANERYYVAIDWLGWRDNSVVRLYVNGEQVASEKMQYRPPTNDNAAYIGWESTTGSFSGTIDEVRISDEARGEAYLSNYYQGATSAEGRHARGYSRKAAGSIRAVAGTNIRIALPATINAAAHRVALYGLDGTLVLQSRLHPDREGTVVLPGSSGLSRGTYVVRVSTPTQSLGAATVTVE